jgi:hypothetical protein
MIFIQTLWLSENGLFDFDLTFPAEIILFFLLSYIIIKVFLNPISIELADRAEFLGKTITKSICLLNIGYKQVDGTLDLMVREVAELKRQLRFAKEYTTEKFEEEIRFVQKKSLLLLSEVKGDLALKSVVLFSSLLGDIDISLDKFFEKKFKSK